MLILLSYLHDELQTRQLYLRLGQCDDLQVMAIYPHKIVIAETILVLYDGAYRVPDVVDVEWTPNNEWIAELMSSTSMFLRVRIPTSVPIAMAVQGVKDLLAVILYSPGQCMRATKTL